MGIGFIGAGTIFKSKERIEGLTTAAALWMASAIGLLIGAKFYPLALCATLFSLVVLVGFGFIEERFLS